MKTIGGEEKKQHVILAVDDVAENLELLARNLQRLGHKVLLATSGAKAIELANAKKPDLILMDVQMPLMTGFEACKMLKENPQTANIPIIFLTAKAEYDSVIEGFSMGAVDYVLKPFYNEELFARVKAHLTVKELSDAVAAKNRMLTRYIDMIEHNIAISQTDANGIVIYISEALSNITGYAKDELIGQKHCCFKSGCTHESVYRELWSTITSGKTWRGELLDAKKNKELFWAELTINPDFDENGEIVGYLAIWHDITDKKRVEQLIVIDPLTELYNRRHLDNELNRVIDLHVRESQSFGFLMIDIDYFKTYNDFYGHQQGDAALIAVAKTIKKSLHRPGDSAFRFGGEEFCAILSNINEEGLLIVANNIKTAIENLNIEHQKSELGHLSVSIGIAAMNAIPTTFDETVRVADKALYTAKESGRNRVSF
ncbi:MAG TPA: diguanylate cyclase [Campylobacterales bacterium]|nr:diguanylate cyclase [Campylobacterales bacterium]